MDETLKRALELFLAAAEKEQREMLIEVKEVGCTCFRAEGKVTMKDPWCPFHKEYLFEYESKPE